MTKVKELSISYNTTFSDGDVRSFMYQVKTWNEIHRRKNQFILIYTLGNGSMVDTPRQKGYVVEKHHSQGGKRSKFHSNIEKAMADYYSNNF